MGFKVQLSKQEASSKVLEPIPSGWYKVTISDVNLKESKSAKNAGKPYYAIEHTVSEGPHEGRKVFSNVMLFEGALYSAVQLIAALTGEQPDEGELEIPDADELIGQDLYAKVKITPERTVTDENGEKKTYEKRNEVAGYKSLSSGQVTGTASKGGSLLPS